MADTRPPIKERVREALASPTLATALDRALPTFRVRRGNAFAGRDFPALQEALARRRAAGVDRLPELIEQFTAEATKVGCVVHRAADAAEARHIVGEIARARGVRLAVKSKSMATEEVELNAYLEREGLRVVETDLGERIIQLAGEHPSHLLAPSLHKTREQVAALFSAEAGQEIPDDAESLVAYARKMLRQSFVDADLGITGANIAIAQTGTLVILENEGNGRLVSTLPPVHVALVGIDKLVPTLDDASEILKMLAPSATGQQASTYVSFISGPSRTADIELSLTIGVHGPREVHVVLLDNGRTAMRDDPVFRAALQCIRCGACANVCPPYQEVGGHVFGHIYTGPIGLILTAFHHGIENAYGPQKLCVSCNTCDTVCPVGIPLAGQILEIRERAVAEKGLSWLKKTIFRTMADPARADLAAKLGSVAQAPLAGRDRLIRSLPLLGGLTEWRSLPALARRPLRERVRARQSNGRATDAPSAPTIPGSKAAGLTVAYFAGCLTDRLFPEMGESLIAVLEALGVRVVFPMGQNCCGLPAINSGDGTAARAMARQTIPVLEAARADYIISGSTSCIVTVLQDYPRLFADEPAWQVRAEALGRRVIDFTHFVHDVADLPTRALAGDPPLRVTCHDSCQSHNCLGLEPQARRLVTEVMGLELIEMHEPGFCCGFGGSFSLEFPEVSRRILRRKIAHAEATQASVVVTDNPGCILQIRGGMDAKRLGTRVLHLAELMAERIGERV